MPDSPSSEESRSSLASITRGASLFLAGNILSKAFKFILNFLLTRGLGASLYGIYAYTQTIISLVIIFGRLGTGKSILKFLPAYEDSPQRRNRIVGLAYLTILLGSIFLGTILYHSAHLISEHTLENPLLVKCIKIFALTLPFQIIIGINNSIFRGLEKIEYQVILDDFLQPLTQIAVVFIALFLGYSLIGTVAALAIGFVLVCCSAIALLYNKTSIRPSISVHQSRGEISEFFNYSLPLTLKDVGSILYTRVDILMVGFFLTERAVGIYQISVLVATLLALPLTAFNQLFPPVASRLHANNKKDELQLVYETVTRWSVTITIFPTLVIGLYSSEVLSIFGSEFTTGALVLSLFTINQFTNSVVGPSGFLLMMTDHQYLNLINHWALGILNIVFNYLFIVEFGLIGAAVSTACVLSLINIVRLIEVWYTEGLIPYSTTFWKPLAAGAVSGVTLLAFSTILNGYILLISGSIFSGIVFVGLLVMFGIEEQDREFFADIVEGRI